MAFRHEFGSWVALMAAALLLLPPGRSLAAESDDWMDRGGAEAEAAVAACLKTMGLGDKRACVRRPYDACVQRHGDQQLTMNMCSKFARDVWAARLEIQVRRVVATPAARRVGGVVETQRRWEQWEEQDCAVQSALSEGGSMHAGQLNLCRLRHIGDRAVELEAMADWWETR